MALFTKLGKEINRPVDASGDQRGASMADEARWKTEAERFIAAATGTPSLIFDDRTVLDASLNYPANTFAWVIGDSTAANNGVYSKIGASGAGSWTRLGDLPYSFISALNSGAGTADAILADTDIAPPLAAYGAMFLMNVTTANTGAVTVSLNGGTAKALKTNTGNDLDAGYLVSGMLVVFVDDGTNYRMISDADSAANLAAAEAAKDTAVAAAATASAAATTATNAATTATTAAAASANSVGAMIFDFDSGTSDADPGDGEFALNNADPALATEMYIDVLDNAGVDVSAWIETWDDSSNTAKGTLTIRSRASSAVFRIYNVTGSVVTASTYRKVTIAHVSGSGTLSGECAISFARAGNAGAAGSGTGDMLEATYDPNGYGADAFSMGNMQETSTAKILTATERATIGEVRRATPTPPTFAYRFKEGQPLPSALTFTRASTAVRRNRAGLLETVAANMLRHHYAVDGTYLGILIEQGAENLCLQSENLAATWSATRASVSSNATTDPFGTSWDKIVQDSTAASSHFVSQSFSFTSGTTYCYSAFFKAAEMSWVRLALPGTGFNGGGGNVVAYFNASTGAVGTTLNSPIEAGVEDYGNGWYRCWVSKAADSTTSGTFTIILAEADNDITIDGDGSSGVYCGGVQFEAGVARPTSYVPTTTTTVTRSADFLSGDKDGIGWSDSQATLYADAMSEQVSGTNAALLYARETGLTGVALYFNSSNVYATWRDSGTNTKSTSRAFVSGELFKAAGVFSSAGVNVSADGSTESVSAGTQSPTVAAIWIGRGTNSGTSADDQYLNGTIREFAIWDRALTAAEMAIVTTRGPAIGETLYAPETMKRVGLPISRLLGSGDGVAANLQAVFDGAPNGSTFIFEDTVDWGSTRPTSPYITLPRTVRLEWKQPWDLTGFTSTTSSPIILQRGGELTGSAIDLDGTPSLTAGETDRLTVASGQGGNFAVGERWLLHATASLTTLTGAFSLLEAAGSPYWNRRCESVWIERVEGDVVYFTKPISDDYPNSCDPRLIKYDDDIDIELINPMVDAYTPYADVDEGNWVTSTAYSVGDHVIYANRGYVCISAHTSDSTNFSTDYSANRWLDMGSDRFIDVTLARRLHIIGGRARRLSGMFARISGVADLKIDGLRGDMNDKGSTAPGGFLYVGGDTDGARFRDLDVTGGGQPFMQSSTAAHYGIFRNAVWENCISRGSLNGAFSQHNLEEGTTYRGCKVFDCDGPAFDVRTRDVTIDGPVVRRSGTGVYHRLVATGFRLRNFDFRECLAGYRLTTFSGAHEVTPGDITIENGTMLDIGGVGSTGGISAVYGYDVPLGKLMVTNVAIEMNNASSAIEIAGRWNRPELRSVSLIGTSGTGRALYMHDESLGSGKGPYAPALNGINHETNYAAPLIVNYGGYPSLRDIKKLNATTEVMTLASDALTTMLIYESIAVAAQSGTSDTLSTLPIMALETRRVLFADTGDTITVSVTIGNIRRADGGTGDITLTGARMIMVEARGSFWYIL